MELALAACRRCETAGIKQFINGPESFTPDGNFILGEAPEVRGIFVGAGFNAFGIASGGGAGMALAEWVAERRAAATICGRSTSAASAATHRDATGCATRTLEAYAKHYTMAWPHRGVSSPAGRCAARRSTTGSRRRAPCFGEKLGWERPNWFADRAGERAARRLFSYGRQNWFAAVGREHKAARERVALFDQTSFAKFLLRRPRCRAGAVVDLRQRRRASRRAASSTRRC